MFEKRTTVLAMMAAVALSLAAAAPVYDSGRADQGREMTEPLLLAQAGYRGGAYLGNLYEDREKMFSIQPPAQWFLDRKNPRYAVKFSARNYEAFIMVDVIPVDEPVKIDDRFRKFINEKNKEVKETIPSFQVISNLPTVINRLPAYVTEAAFEAGTNRALISIHYVPGKTKIFMITTVCPEATVKNWEKVFQASVNTFTVLE